MRTIGLAYATSLLGTVSSLLMTVGLMRDIALTVPPADLGAFTLISQVAAYLAFAQCGLDVAVSLAVTAALGAGDTAGAGRACGAIRSFSRWTAAGIVAVAGAAAGVAWWGGEPLWAGLVLLAVGNQSLNMLSRPPAAALAGAQRIPTLTGVRVAQGYGTVAAGLALFAAGLGVYSLAVAELLCTLGGWLALERLAAIHCPWAAGGRPSAAEYRRLLGVGVWATVGAVGGAAEAGLDLFLVGFAPGEPLVGVAAAGLWLRFPTLAVQLCSLLINAAFSPLAAAYAAGPVAFRPLAERLVRLHAGVAAGAVVCVGGWLAWVVGWWLAGRYAQPAGEWYAVLLIGQLTAKTGVQLLAMVLLASGDTVLANTAVWGTVAVKLGLGVLLAAAVGLPGVPAAGLLGWAVPAVGLAVVLGRRGVMRPGVTAEAWAVWAVGLAAAGGLGLLVRATTPGAVAGVIGMGATAVVVGGGVLGWLVTARVVGQRPVRVRLRSA